MNNTPPDQIFTPTRPTSFTGKVSTQKHLKSMIFTLHLGSRLSTDQVPRQSKVPLSHVAFAHFPLLLWFSLSLSTSSHAPPVYHHDFSATFFLHTIHTVSPPFCTKSLFSHSPLHPRISPPNFPIMLIFRRFNRCRFSLLPHTTPFF